MRLRLEAAARAAGRTSFDITERDRLVHPRAATESHFLGPNGMSMRPLGSMLAVIVANFRGGERGRIFEVPAGTPLPPELVLLHEHSDHYAVQPAVAMSATALNAALTAWLAQPAVLCMQGKSAFYERHPSMRPEAVGFSENA